MKNRTSHAVIAALLGVVGIGAVVAATPAAAVHPAVIQNGGYQHTSPPARVFDSRLSAFIGAGTQRLACTGVMNEDVVMVNITVLNTTAGGWLAATNGETPTTSDVNWEGANQIITDTVPVRVDNNGCFILQMGPTSGAHVLVDRRGYFVR